MGAIPHNPFIIKAIGWYKENHPRTPTPIVMTSLFQSLLAPEKLVEKKQIIYEVKIYPHKTFYPYSKDTVRNFKYSDLTSETFAIHFWNYSWGHPLNKFFKKIGIYNIGKKLSDKIGIKKALKKLLNFE